ETYEFVKEIEFSQIHVFKYSPRQGTPAADYTDQINGNVKEERSKRLISLGKKLEKEFYKKFIATEKEVLFEQENPNRENYYEGLTNNYIRVFAFSEEDIKGCIRKVTLEKN